MVKSVNHIWDLLNDVFDPEVPVLSVVDLGIVRSVEDVENMIHVTITPTLYRLSSNANNRKRYKEKT